jgi:Cu-processing system permease protein
MNHQIRTIARYTFLEAVRVRLPRLSLLAVLVVLAASFFISEIAITESTRLQVAFYAAAMRLTAVFFIALHVLTSITREFNDKGHEMTLALEVSRAHYIAGKLCGFTGCAVLLAFVAGLPLAALASAPAALQWTVSLALELTLVVALSLFCVMTFSQLIPAASAVLAFYVLARTLTDIRLLSTSPLADVGFLSQRVTGWLTEGLALVLPSLDGWTRTAWLVNEPARWGELAQIAGYSALYAGLLAAATMFDFYRKNL